MCWISRHEFADGPFGPADCAHATCPTHTPGAAQLVRNYNRCGQRKHPHTRPGRTKDRQQEDCNAYTMRPTPTRTPPQHGTSKRHRHHHVGPGPRKDLMDGHLLRREFTHLAQHKSKHDRQHQQGHCRQSPEHMGSTLLSKSSDQRRNQGHDSESQTQKKPNDLERHKIPGKPAHAQGIHC